MGKIQIVFFNINGTILNPKTNEISEKTIEAIRKLKNKGIKVCATTRLAPSYIQSLTELEFDAYVAFDGKFCYAENSLIFAQDSALDNGKSRSVEKILEFFQLHKDESLAFAAVDNDIEMFSPVGYIVAMKDATKKLKSIAHELCGSVYDDGIYHFLLNKFII